MQTGVQTGASRWARVVVLLAALAMIAPAALAAPDTLEEAQRDLERTREQQEATRAAQERKQRAVEAAKRDLHHASQQVADAQARLAEIEQRLREAQEELAALEAEHERAVVAHDEAFERSEEANRRLTAADNRLRRVQSRLQERQGTFDSRVAATYKYGTVNYAQVLVEARDFEEFLQSYYYVRSAMGFDQHVIDEITALTVELVERRAEVARLRDLAAEEEAAAEAARERAEQLAAEQRELTDRVAEERAEQAAVTAELRAAQQRYEAQVAELEAESQALEAELRELVDRESEREAQIQRMKEERRRRAASAPSSSSGSTSCQAGWTPKQLAWPSDGCVTSGFGWRTHPIYGTKRMHTGVDIPGPTGQTIVSATEGYVVSAGWRGGYGLAVVVDHGGGLATLYAHMSAISVQAGQYVEHAQKVGEIGSTGQSTGPHLHFEVRVDGEPRDPMNWY